MATTGARVAGWLLALSAPLFFASLLLDAGSPRLASVLRPISLLLMVPGALAWGARLAPRAPRLVWVATLAGVASLVIWAAAGRLVPWSWEPVYIALSAAWWLGIAGPMRAVRPRLGVFTLVVGAFAASDFVVSLAYDHIPFWAFALLGGPKIPLSLAWNVWAGIALARRG